LEETQPEPRIKHSQDDIGFANGIERIGGNIVSLFDERCGHDGSNWGIQAADASARRVHEALLQVFLLGHHDFLDAWIAARIRLGSQVQDRKPASAQKAEQHAARAMAGIDRCFRDERNTHQ
jgi:hypothetical protein